MKIGLFGGTFNPIHRGHLRAALEVQQTFALEKTYFIPSALPPHKEPRGVSDAKDRMEMTRLAVIEYPGFTVSDVELKRSGPSYTIDTVLGFKSTMPENAELYFILGIDAFLEIDTWKSYRNLFQLIPFIVMPRPDAACSGTRMMWDTLEAHLKSSISDGYRFSVSKACFIHDEKQPIFVPDIAALDISSTKIRKRVKEGRSIASLVPESVEDFIKRKGLYL